MANRIIPDLTEKTDGFASDNLVIIDTGAETYKVTIATLAAILAGFRRTIDVIFDGVTTGQMSVDVTTYVDDARKVLWALKKPAGGSTNGEQVSAIFTTPNATTVIIDTGDFALDAGTYSLLGV